MDSNKTDLLALIEAIKGRNILVIGDVMLDKYVWGDTGRVSPEAPVLVVDAQKYDQRLGGAGNVVNNLLSLGANVSLCGLIGNDVSGEFVQNRLKELGVNADGLIADSERPTTTKERVIARNQQIVRIDHEVRSAASADSSGKLLSVIKEKLPEVDGVIVSDYAKGVIVKELLDLLRNETESGTISLKSKPLMLDPKPSNIKYYAGLNMIKPNKPEAEELSGIKIVDQETALAAARKIKNDTGIDLILVSLGSDGSIVLSDEHPDGLYSKTLARKVFDVSGAGDTVVSTFTAALSAGASQQLAADLANLAASVVVSKVGTMPVHMDGLLEQIDYYSSTQ